MLNAKMSKQTDLWGKRKPEVEVEKKSCYENTSASKNEEKKARTFQTAWLGKYKWLRFDTVNDLMFWH